MKILVTGANGFIGREIIKGLLQVGKYDIIGQARTKSIIQEVSGVRYFRCNLAEEFNLNEPVDYIVHCAAIQDSYNISIKEFILSTLAITENIAKYAKNVGVSGVIFTSSLSIHGEIRDDVVNEKTAVINPTVYGISKQLSEQILSEYSESFPVVSLRLCGVVGSGAKKVWLTRVLSSALRGEDIHIVNAERQFNNLLHTDDILKLIVSLIGKGFTGFNAFPIGSSSPLSIRTVVELVVSGVASSSRIIDDGTSNNSFVISNDYAINSFMYEPLGVAENLNKFVLGNIDEN